MATATIVKEIFKALPHLTKVGAKNFSYSSKGPASLKNPSCPEQIV